jgi:hypothetical protein
LVVGRNYGAFWSYTRFDNDNDGRWLTALRQALIAEVRASFGKHIEIFQDMDGIEWGERWKSKLKTSSDDALFLIPIITPSYLASPACREELKEFVDREEATGFKESILPLYYIDTPGLQGEFEKAADLLAQIVAEHNYEDIRELRHRSIDSYEARQKIKKLAVALIDRINGYARRDLLSPAMRASFTAPPNGAKVPRTVLLRGTRENIAAGVDVWLVVETGGVYHPQKHRLPAGGTFEAPVIIGRRDDDHLHEFTVHALAVTEDVSRQFSQYQRDSASFKKWRGLPKPADSKVLATLKLIRDDSASYIG